MKHKLILLALITLCGCGKKFKFEPPPSQGKYSITMSNGWASSGGRCHSYKIDGNRVTLFDADGKVKGEAIVREGWALAIDRVE